MSDAPDGGPDADSFVRTVAKGSTVLVAGFAAEVVVSLVAKLLIARYLGQVGFGAVSIGITLLTLSSTLALVGLHTGVGRYLPRFEDEGRRRGVLVSAVTVAVPLSLAAGAVLFVLAGPIASGVFHDPAVAPVVRVFGAAVPFAVLMRLAVGASQGLQVTLPKVALQNVTIPVTRFALVAVVLAVGAGTVGASLAYAVPYVLAGLFGLYYLASRTPAFDRSVQSTPVRGELLRFSAPLVITAATVRIMADIDTFVLGYFAPTGAVGVYNVVYPVGQLLTLGLAAFSFIAMPVFSELDVDDRVGDMRRLYQVSSKWIFLGSFPVFLVVFLFPAATIRLTFGAEYVEGATALSVLALGFFVHAVVGLNGRALTSIGRTRLQAADNAAAAGVNLALNLVLIPRYSYLGAAVATAATYLFRNALFSYQLYRETGIQPLSPALVRPAAAALALAGGTYWVVAGLLTPTPAVVVAGSAAFLALYAVAVVRFGGVEQEEVMLVNSVEEQYGVDLGPVKRALRALLPE